MKAILVIETTRVVMMSAKPSGVIWKKGQIKNNFKNLKIHVEFAM